MAKKYNPMDLENKNIAPTEPTAEELEAEKQQLEEVKEDELREKLAEDLGINPDDNQDLLDKAVQRELDQRKKLSEAIGQKIKYREALKSKITSTPEAKPKEETEKPDVRSEILSVLEEERLNDMDVPQELKDEIKKIAKVSGISVKEAAKDPYIVYRKEQLETEIKSEEAAISRTKKGIKTEFDPTTPPDVDLSTEEGQKAYAEWDKKLKAHEAKKKS